MNLSDEYVAGLFDGEGWFQIDRSKRPDCKSPSFQAHARVCMRDREMIMGLRARYGGSVRQSGKATDKHAAYWSWDVCGVEAAAFAVTMQPLLRLKHRQAALVVSFQALKSENRNRPNSAERVAALTSFYVNMKDLNRKGVSR